MGRVVHFEIHAQDPDRAEAFYTGVFGWTAESFGGPVDYRLLTTGPEGDMGINGAILKPPHDMTPSPGQAVNAFVCTIAVDSIEDIERAVRRRGRRAGGRAPGDPRRRAAEPTSRTPRATSSGRCSRRRSRAEAVPDAGRSPDRQIPPDRRPGRRSTPWR